MSELIGADVLARALGSLGAECVFGLPGTQNVPTFQAFRRARLRTVLCVHELGAAFMANGYARATGKVGVIATIPGPGFAYALPGIAEARLDSAALLHIVGQPPVGAGGRFLHQSIPQAGMVADLAKAVIPVDRPDEIQAAVQTAWRTALSGDPGPVVLHLARDAQSRAGEFMEGRELSDGSDSSLSNEARERIDELARRLHGARRTVLFLGQGAADGGAGVRSLVDRIGAAFFTTLSGRGVVDERHPRCLRFDPDRSSVSVLNQLIDESDLILALGCRMAFNGTAAFGLELPEAKLAHVNTDADALHGLRPAGLAVEGRVERVVPVLLDRLSADALPSWSVEEVETWRNRLVNEARAGPSEPSFDGVPTGRPRVFFEALRQVLPDHGIVVTDSGLHQVLTRRHLAVSTPRGLITPADFQSMGFGVPAAIGARLGAPDRPVVAIVGDGGFSMAAMELLTAVREEVRLVVVVINDGYLNLIRLQQLGDDGVTHAVELQNPDFAKLAEALGVGYGLVNGDAEEVLGWALEQAGPILIEVIAGDSKEILAARAQGVVRRVARRAVGARLRRRVKRLLGRG